MPGRGSRVHVHFQGLIASRAKSLGFETRIEKRLSSGGYVDVYIEDGDKKIAIEVSVVPEILREFRNIEKCLKEDYQYVICLFLDKNAADQAKTQAANQWSDDVRRRIIIAQIDELDSVLSSVSADGI